MATTSILKAEQLRDLLLLPTPRERYLDPICSTRLKETRIVLVVNKNENSSTKNPRVPPIPQDRRGKLTSKHKYATMWACLWG